jgi:hypothetical protein
VVTNTLAYFKKIELQVKFFFVGHADGEVRTSIIRFTTGMGKNWRTRELPRADWAGKLPKTHNITFFNLTEMVLLNINVTV